MASSLTWVFALTLRSTVVLTVALALVALLRRRRAVACHGLLTLTAASLLLLPALPGLLPRWELRLPRIPSAESGPQIVQPLREDSATRNAAVARGEAAGQAVLASTPTVSGKSVGSSPAGTAASLEAAASTLWLTGVCVSLLGLARALRRERRLLVSVAPARGSLGRDAGRGPTLDRRVPSRGPAHVCGDRRPDDERLETAGLAAPARGGAVVRGEAAGGRAARARPRAPRRRSPSSPLAAGRRALLVPSPGPSRRARGERRRRARLRRDRPGSRHAAFGLRAPPAGDRRIPERRAPAPRSRPTHGRAQSARKEAPHDPRSRSPGRPRPSPGGRGRGPARRHGGGGGGGNARDERFSGAGRDNGSRGDRDGSGSRGDGSDTRPRDGARVDRVSGRHDCTRRLPRGHRAGPSAGPSTKVPPAASGAAPKTGLSPCNRTSATGGGCAPRSRVPSASTSATAPSASCRPAAPSPSRRGDARGRSSCG